MTKVLKNIFKNLIHIIKTYCLNTNLHGFIYIAQPFRHKIERIFWSLLILVSLILTGILINKLLVASQKNPTIIYTDQSAVRVQDLNFPAVSVCPGVILDTPKRLVFDYKDVLTKLANDSLDPIDLTDHQLRLLQILSLISRDGYISSEFTNFSMPTDDFIELLHTFEPFFYKTQDSFTNKTIIFFHAAWLKNFYATFTQTLWKGGFCYTFNFPQLSKMFKFDQISRDFKYKSYTPDEIFGKLIFSNSTTPFKSPLPGNGLVVRYNERMYDTIGQYDTNDPLYKTNVRINYFNILDRALPGTPFQGQRLFFHDSFEVIPLNAMELCSRPDSITKILITPSIRRIDDSLKEKSPKDRNCYLPGERKLKFLKVYTKINCEHECLAQMTLDTCKCVQFFMVRNRTSRICGLTDEKCYLNVETKFLENNHHCKCLENCERVKYEAHVPSSESQNRNIYDWHRMIESKIVIEMSTHVVLAVNKRQSSTIIDFLSLSGGFLGLFAGFSVLSAAEIFYYFFILPILELRRRNSSRVYPIHEEIRFERKFTKLLKKMLQESSIHGFNHIGNDDKSVIERLIWLISFIASMTCTYLMVKQVYNMSSSNLVSVAFEGKITNVRDIPFPAVTIQGSLYKWKRDYMLDLFNSLNGLYKGEAKEFLNVDYINKTHNDNSITDVDQVVAIICAEGELTSRVEQSNFKFSSPSSFLNGYYKFMKASLNENWFNDRFAMWDKKTKPDFSQILTKFGISYAFNMIDSSKLFKTDVVTKDHQYSFNKTSNYPWKTGSSEFEGFRVAFASQVKGFVCIKSAVAFHSPFELPNSNEFRSFEPGYLFNVGITPSITKADDELKDLSIDSRKCYFKDERKLKFFKIYTQQNCEFECLSIMLREKCNCVPFYYIRSSTWEVCELRRMKLCVEKVLYERSIGNASENNCNCLPSCNSVSYTFEIIKEKLTITNSEKIVSLQFYYKDSEYFALLRYRGFKLVDFLSYVGGILGLFAGISVLSFVEIFYFFTIRLITDLLSTQ